MSTDLHQVTAQRSCHMFTCSVEGIVGVEDCGEEAKGERADTEGHVKAGVPESLEHLCVTEQTMRLKRR